MAQVTFVFSPDHDWVHVYNENVCVSRGHSGDVKALLTALGYSVRTMETTEEFADNGAWPDDFSQFPGEHLRYDRR